MPKTPPPMLGFNNNVRHQWRIFHIQTEDSGVKRPHVITHLFGDGGRILKSQKTTYAEHLEREDISKVVRQLMKDQHKAMFVALRQGDFDAVILDALGPPPAPKQPVAKSEAAPADAPASAPAEPEQPAVQPAAPGAPLVAPEPPPAAAEPAVTPPSPAPSEAPLRPSNWPLPLRPSQPHISVAPALRDSDAPMRAAAIHPSRPSPPPRRGTPSLGTPRDARPRSDPDMGRYSVLEPVKEERPGRYAVAGAASIFSEEQPKSIFGGDELIGEKSLDEVILSYLAEDLEQK